MAGPGALLRRSIASLACATLAGGCTILFEPGEGSCQPPDSALAYLGFEEDLTQTTWFDRVEGDGDTGTGSDNVYCGEAAGVASVAAGAGHTAAFRTVFDPVDPVRIRAELFFEQAPTQQGDTVELFELGQGEAVAGVTVDAAGKLELFAFSTVDGDVRPSSARFAAGEWHEVALIADAAGNEIALGLDGKTVLSSALALDGASINAGEAGIHDATNADPVTLYLDELIIEKSPPP